MKVYRCPKCQSSNCSVLYKVDETVSFKCQICEQYFSIKNEPAIKDDKKGLNSEGDR